MVQKSVESVEKRENTGNYPESITNFDGFNASGRKTVENSVENVENPDKYNGDLRRNFCGEMEN